MSTVPFWQCPQSSTGRRPKTVAQDLRFRRIPASSNCMAHDRMRPAWKAEFTPAKTLIRKITDETISLSLCSPQALQGKISRLTERRPTRSVARLAGADLSERRFDRFDVRAGHVVVWVERKRLSEIGHGSLDIISDDSNVAAIGVCRCEGRIELDGS